MKQSRVPPPFARRWIELVLAFGVSVMIGLAPLLGTLNVPFFKGLINLFPRIPIDTVQIVLPFAGLAMGVVALAYQFKSLGSDGQKTLQKHFMIALILFCFGLVALLVVHVTSVEQVGVRQISVLVGFGEAQCQQCVGTSRSGCVYRILGVQNEMQECFGGASYRLALLAMILSYLVSMCSLGVMVGNLVLRESLKRNGGPRRGPKSRKAAGGN